MPHSGTDFGKAARHGLHCPCGEQLSGVPGELGQYARTPFPQHSPHASESSALPGKTKTPRKIRGAPAGSSSLASPVSRVSMPEPLFPSTAPTQVNPPPHFPENKNTPGSPGCSFLLCRTAACAKGRYLLFPCARTASRLSLVRNLPNNSELPW